jgi:STE24 endopeptidase
MRTIAGALCAMLLLLINAIGSPAVAQPAPAPTSQVQVQSLTPLQSIAPAASFDAERATDAYLATVKGEARKNSDSYFEGGYWLLLVDALYAIAVAGLLLWSRISARMREFAQSRTRSRFWQAAIYVVLFLVVFTVAEFPLAVYEGFVREHAYGLSNMSFPQWLGDLVKGFGVELVFGTIVLTLIYAAIRGAGAGSLRWCFSSSGP